MKIQVREKEYIHAVKLGQSRQVVIPKKLHDYLGLVPGDYLEVELKGSSIVFTPKTLVDKDLEKRLAESLDDVRHGRVHGPFSSAKELVRSLQKGSRRYNKRRIA